ncbi:MAG: hypothetical protein NDJ89_17835 [Oligoflexia bacterium]|nr:hypothetical protein [Oligoflexia bacterium]
MSSCDVLAQEPLRLQYRAGMLGLEAERAALERLERGVREGTLSARDSRRELGLVASSGSGLSVALEVDLFSLKKRG